MHTNVTPSICTQENGNASHGKKMYRTMSHVIERHTTLDEYLDIFNKTFKTEEEAYTSTQHRPSNKNKVP